MKKIVRKFLKNDENGNKLLKDQLILNKNTLKMSKKVINILKIN